MKQINSLTENQKSLLTAYRDKWMEIGLSCKPANHELAEKWCREAYIVAGKEPPKQIIWADSPLSGMLVYRILKNNLIGGKVWASVGDSVWASVRDSVWASVWDSVGDSVGVSVGVSVWDSVRDSVWVSVRDSVRASVGDSVGDSVRDSVGDSVRASVGDSVRVSVGDSFGDLVYGQHDAGGLGFYNFFLEVCKLESCKRLFPLMEHAKNCGWWIPCENVAILEEKTRIVQLKEGRIHCETGPAIAYADGFEVYGLNGIRVPKELVMTPADKLDAQLVLKEQNVDIRREIVRKIGVERLLKELNAQVIDTWKDYELFILDLGDGRNCPYLKMINPSIGTVHVEGVEPGIRTVKHALAWRNGLKKFIEPIWIS